MGDSPLRRSGMLEIVHTVRNTNGAAASRTTALSGHRKVVETTKSHTKDIFSIPYGVFLECVMIVINLFSSLCISTWGI